MKRYLVLEDGSIFEGEAFGGKNFQVGELVFNTSMVAYQDILCDGSYFGQIINLTYPVVGNYGINREGFESLNTHVFGLIIGDLTDRPSNWKSQMSLEEFLKLRNIPGIKDIDTRKLTSYIRDKGSQRAIMTDDINKFDELVSFIRKSKKDINLVDMVSIQKPFHIPNDGEKIVLIDFGAIDDTIKVLNLNKMDVTLVPYDTSSDDILGLHPDGVILSNGPGNPEILNKSIESCKRLLGRVPLFGIGLGHQIIGLASGAKVDRLKFGNRGDNYPIKILESGKIIITSKNNSYEINRESLKNTNLEEYAISVNYKSVEACISKKDHIYSVQFRPKINFDGEVDFNYRMFFNMVDRFKGEKNA